MNLIPWEICSLEIDEDGARIGRYFQKQGLDIRRVFIEKSRLEQGAEGIGKEELAEIIESAIPAGRRVIALCSDGSFHYLAYGLCKRAERISRDLGYIQIDHHADAADSDKTGLLCGNFARAVLREKGEENALFVGNRYFPERSITEEDLRANGLHELERMLRHMPDNIYVTTELDVTAPEVARTAFSRGKFTRDELVAVLSCISANKNIISADIFGFTTRYCPYEEYEHITPPSFEKTMAVYRDAIKALTGGGR
ncbi:MAG: arginase family protein [Nanoarchaeota archaeon]|nr:arginase family protein [Nanoarchaeota archaeon]